MMAGGSGSSADTGRADAPGADPAAVDAARSAQDGKRRRYMDEQDRSRRLKAQILSVFTVITGLGYLAWIVFALNPEHRVIGVGFLASEAACLILFACAASTMWRLRFKPPESPSPDRPYSVDILVPTCGEPIEVVTRTLQACLQIRPTGPMTVYVLDDGGSDEVRALAGSLGFHYHSRKFAGVECRDAKAGNLNFGLAHASSELVLVLDADQVPHPNVLEALTGYMRFGRVACG